MEKFKSTREVLDSIISDTKNYKAKFEKVNAESEKTKADIELKKVNEIIHEISRPENFTDTKFMREVSAQQNVNDQILFSKQKETEALRQQTKCKKVEIETAIKNFYNNLKGEL